MAEINSPNPHLLVNQTYVPSSMEWQYVNNPAIMLGPWLVGALIDFMFTGILLQQFYFYTTNFKEDPLHIKVIVWVTMICAILKTVQVFLIVWLKLVIGYGDWRDAASWPWQDWTEPILGASLGASAQTYFAVRCYRLSGRKTWFLLGLFFLMFISWGCSVGVALEIGLRNPYIEGRIPHAVVPMLVSTIFVDSVITIVTLFYLVRSRKGFNPQTDTMAGRLILITFEAALPPALSAICDVITSVTQTGNIHAAFNMLTPRLYAYSLLFTLNARVSTRELAASGSDHVSIQVSGLSDGARHTKFSVGARAQSWFPSNTTKSQVNVGTETVMHHGESSSARYTNMVDLSPHLEDPREGVNSKEDEASSVSTTWGPEGKVFEMDTLRHARSQDEVHQGT